METEATVRKKARLWPVSVIVALAAVAIVALWAVPEMQRQQRYIRTALVLIGSGFLLVLWLLFLSRLRWSVRLASLAVVILVVVAARFSLRISGVNGDLLPIIEPRWKTRSNLAVTPRSSPALKELKSNHVEGEFVQFYGPERNGVLPGPEIASNWNEVPPATLWRQPVGSAWSGFAVKDGVAVTLEQRGDKECVVAYDLPTGSNLWTHADEAKYSTTIAGEGPRTTPTISSSRVYTFGATGNLSCLDLQKGSAIWSKNLAKEHQAHPPDWGFASSPLVIEGKVIVAVGGSAGSLAAYSAEDGKLVWTSGTGGPDYSSPIPMTLLGTPQVVLFGGKIISHELNGKELWSYPWPGGHPHISLPLAIKSNLVFVSSGYGTGSELVQITSSAEGKWSAERLWKSMTPKSKFGPLFQVGDCFYGLDDGIFSCVELKTGHRKWKDGRYGHGQGLLVGDSILLTTEKGEIVLVRPDPEKLVELARFKVFDDKTWNPPALAGEYLLLRNDKEAACLKLRRAPPKAVRG
jgi:outer membrane protein assembly factor BamB